MRFEIARFPTLTTDRLILREVVAEDADDLLLFRGNAEVQKYNLVPMKDTREALALVRTMQGWYASSYAIQWGITLRGEDRVLGLCGIHDWSRERRRAAIGYDLARTHWGQGIASEAMRAVLRFAFEELDLVHLYALTVVENARSIRLLERLGFQFERVRQELAWENDGRFKERAVYGLPRSAYAGAPDSARQDASSTDHRGVS
jgi:[ribosomal protein S5]-alanine N-acetyltransferase